MDHTSPLEIFRAWPEETPSGCVLHVLGDVDLLSAPSLREQLMGLIGRGRPIIADCSGLRYIDMRGLRVLEDCHRRAEQQGQRLILLGSAPIVRKILEIVKLDQRIPVVETMAEAARVVTREE